MLSSALSRAIPQPLCYLNLHNRQTGTFICILATSSSRTCSFFPFLLFLLSESFYFIIYKMLHSLLPMLPWQNIWQKQHTDKNMYVVSQSECTDPHGREVLVAGVWGSRSHCVHSRKLRVINVGAQLTFSLFQMQPRIPAHETVLPTFRLLLPL